MVRPLDGRAVSGAARALTRHTTWVVAACAAAAVTAAVVPPVLGPQSGQLASGSVLSSSAESSGTSPVASPTPIAITADPIVTAGGGRGGGRGVVAQPATFTGAGDIPAASLQAYQRAAVVINAAIPTCKIQWQLLAAVGRVESDHGQSGGNVVGADGVARPGIFGPVLSGRQQTSRVADTDGGAFDGNTTLDRAFGPMQFIPSTWAVVGVDADGDGKRDPQDIDDAALAAAVYLCGGRTDLSTAAGQRAAVYRYNHSAAYVTTVLSVMKAYLGGDFSSDPVIVDPIPGIVPITPFSPAETPFVRTVRHDAEDVAHRPLNGVEDVAAGTPGATSHPVRPVKPLPPTSPTSPTKPGHAATDDPSGAPTDDPSGDPTGTPTDGASDDPSDDPSQPASDVPTTEAPDPAPSSSQSGDLTSPTAQTGDMIIDQCDLDDDGVVDSSGVPASCGTPGAPSDLATVATDDNDSSTPAPDVTGPAATDPDATTGE